MDKQKALDRLNLIRVWYEDYGTPDADYDAICYAINIIEAQPEELDTLIKALETEHKKLLEMQKALKNVPDTNVGDKISRQAAIDDIRTMNPKDAQLDIKWVEMWLKQLPPVQPEIIHCKDCKHSEYDAMYGDRYCHYNGKAEIVPDNQYCGYSERRTDERSD